MILPVLVDGGLVTGFPGYTKPLLSFLLSRPAGYEYVYWNQVAPDHLSVTPGSQSPGLGVLINGILGSSRSARSRAVAIIRNASFRVISFENASIRFKMESLHGDLRQLARNCVEIP